MRESYQNISEISQSLKNKLCNDEESGNSREYGRTSDRMFKFIHINLDVNKPGHIVKRRKFRFFLCLSSCCITGDVLISKGEVVLVETHQISVVIIHFLEDVEIFGNTFSLTSNLCLFNIL